jgi:hypothetical protein
MRLVRAAERSTFADFTLIGARTLGRGTLEHCVFTAYFLLGADASLVRRQLRISPDTFTATCDRIRYALGRAYRETEPFSLFPLDEYFSSVVFHRETPVQSSLAPAPRVYRPVVPPLAPGRVLHSGVH